MSRPTAHILDKKWRSDDIRIGEDVDFSSLLLPKELLKGLTAAGFKYPSPIQLKAIPVGKIGKDLIVQAKSGTGKTLVFSVVALNMLLKGATHPQVLIMAPTREIACQIRNVIQSVGVAYKGLKCEYFIGGRPLDEDVSRIQGCQVIVGTPGRIKHLISYKILKTAGIRLFVLDEADQLLKESSFTTDIDDIFRALPRDKQLIATSATYPDKLKRLTDKYFRDPLLIRLNKTDIGLLGMVHYYHVIPVSKLPVIAYKEKLKFLENVLLSVKFAQCLVFCNMVSRVENLCFEIKKWGFATSYISSAREQEDRLKAIELLKRFKCKVLVSSDLSSRGIDAENVDLVINFDLPSQLDTYFHRVGRAGRYGSKCASVTFITSDEIEAYERMQNDGNFMSYSLPDFVPEGLISLEPKTKCCVKNEESPLDDGSESSPDFSDEEIDINENGVVKQEKANSLNEGIKLNGHNELSCTSKVEEFASENLTNSSDEKLVDFEVASTESGNSLEMQNQLLDINSNPTNSKKEDDDLSIILESVVLDFDKIDSPASVKLKQLEVVSDVSLSSEIVAVDDENNLKVDISNVEERCENNKFLEKIFDQEDENTENCPPKSDELASNIDGLQQITDTSSSLVDLENESKIIDVKSVAISNDLNTSKNLNNPKSKELITSFITFIEKYENCSKGAEEFPPTDYTKSQSGNVESNDNEISLECLKHYISGLSQYHYDVRKAFMNGSEDLINEIAHGCGEEKSVIVPEIEEQTCLKQNDGGYTIQSSFLDSQRILFSTPKADVLSDAISGDSSGVESSSGSNKDRLIEHFNSRLTSIHKVKPSANKISALENSSGSESSLDTSRNSEDAMHMLTEEFNKVSQERAKCYNKEAANIVNYVESSCSSSSSDSGTSIDSELAADKLEQKFNDLMKAKRSDRGPSKDMEKAKKLLREIQSTKKCFKGIEIVETKKIAELSTTTSYSDTSIDSRNVKHDLKKDKRIQNVKSEAFNKKISESSTSTSDSNTSLDSRSGKNDPKKDKKIQNLKSKIFNNKNSSELSSQKTKTLSGHAEKKFTYSDTESDVDQFSEESPVLQDRPQRKTCKKGKTVSKTGSGCRKKIAKIKIYSGASSSETEKYVDQYSNESGSSLQVGHQRKRKNNKNDETLPKTETSPFDYSNANGISNPYFNPASERHPHFNYQMQPPYHASYPYKSRYSQQRQNQAGQRPSCGTHSNYQMQPTYYASNPSHPQHTHSQANGHFLGPQSSHHMQPACFPNPLSQPYHSECPLREHCQMSRMQLRSNCAGNGHTAGCSADNFNYLRNSDPSTNVQSNYLMQPSLAYNQCCVPSQHPCHPPNETCQSPACAAWYDLFYKQWQFINQSPYF